jgi:hypothetical protein
MSKITSFKDFLEEIKYWLVKPLLQSTGIDNHVVILLITIFATALFATAFLGFVLLFPWIIYINLRRNWKDVLKTNKILAVIGIIIINIVYYQIFKYVGIIGVQRDKYDDYPYKRFE